VRPLRVTAKLVVVLAFKTVYTLEQKRRDNNKKIISLYVGMKDMMGALLLYVFPSTHDCPLHLHLAASRMWKMTKSSHPMAQRSRIA
jgi:hypothetical protein